MNTATQTAPVEPSFYQQYKGWIIFGVIAMVGMVLVGMYNGLVEKREGVNQSWSNIESAYQRRMDLIPNLVETVKGYAEHERTTLTAVTEARAAASQIKLTPELLANPQALANFNKVQGELAGALSRLMVVVEKYPNLKANESFLKLQDEIAGTENRINTERVRYNGVARGYNQAILQFPRNILAGVTGFEKRNYFESDKGATKAPTVTFGSQKK